MVMIIIGFLGGDQRGFSAYYSIFDGKRSTLEVYRLDAGRYRPVPANAAGRFPIAPLRIELGIHEGTYRGMSLPWLRVWESDTGEMIVIAEERLEVIKEALDETRRLLDEEVERAARQRKAAEGKIERLVARLKSLGVDLEPDEPGSGNGSPG